MNSQLIFEKKNPEVVIVGGGISGLLLALKLSKDPKKIENGIMILEKQPQLGGRFFFSSSASFYGKNYEEITNEIFKNSSKKINLSGPGFESMSCASLEALLRHFESHLSEDEKNEFEDFFKTDIVNSISKKNKSYFIKKEFISEIELFAGSSEILTKKESEILRSFIENFYHNKVSQNEEKIIQNENIIFEKSSQWNELSKAAKETLAPIFTAIIGPNWEKALFQNVSKSLWSFFNIRRNEIPFYFNRNMCFEFAIENILRKRGVIIKTLCEVVRVNYSKEIHFQLLLSDEVMPQNKILNCKKLIFAFPLAKCLGIIAKEHFSPSQSRFVSKVKPVSLVVSEISNFYSVKSDKWPETIYLGDQFVFPVERAQGFLTQDERFLFSTKLDYEDSLQAPAVREAVSRLRRAAARVLKSEYSEELKKGARIPQNKINERIVLLPVAYTIPTDMAAHIEVKETKMGIEGLFCCGDSFPGFADEPWKMVVNSVYDVANQL